VTSPMANNLMVPRTIASVPSAYGFGPGRNYSANSGIWQVPTWHVPTTQAPYRYMRFGGPMYQYPKSRAAIQAAADLAWHKEQRSAYRKFCVQLEDAHKEHRSYVKENRGDVIDMVKGSMELQMQRLQQLEDTLLKKETQPEEGKVSASTFQSGTANMPIHDIDMLLNNLVSQQEGEHRVTYQLVGAVRDLLAWDVAENVNFRRSLKYARQGVDDDQSAEEDRLRLLKLAMEQEQNDMMHLTKTDKRRMQSDLDRHTKEYFDAAGHKDEKEEDDKEEPEHVPKVGNNAEGIQKDPEDAEKPAEEEKATDSKAKGKGMTEADYARSQDHLYNAVMDIKDEDGKNGHEVKGIGRPRQGLGLDITTRKTQTTSPFMGENNAQGQPKSYHDQGGKTKLFGDLPNGGDANGGVSGVDGPTDAAEKDTEMSQEEQTAEAKRNQKASEPNSVEMNTEMSTPYNTPSKDQSLPESKELLQFGVNKHSDGDSSSSTPIANSAEGEPYHGHGNGKDVLQQLPGMGIGNDMNSGDPIQRGYH